ncbi:MULTISPECIES: TIGR01777 family oxidoreductase [Oceanobacillus]|uniref:TIGR01777 family oxidoreductase n=1 Tax=Oceanobacillus aidingensis TaxID=645964 RepID=A0ABV9JU93_9BACI|nr:TIGR01777 family oxidoreductase [Oceanobacillus oncorhynchi]UUI41638.1 TIGR01777 family oxidoreductase [Oceanobacillus oncorhynchi]
MNILITGGTGFFGSKLAAHLTGLNHKLYILTRSPEKKSNTSHLTFKGYDTTADELPRIDAVINLAGESLFGYWTKKKKETILTSRLRVTKYLVQLMKAMKEKPDVFISGSAVGFYGMSEDFIYTEATTQPGTDFLASVTRQWENEASEAEELGIRTIYARFGILLGKDGGAFPLMSLPVKLYTGGHISDGEQWLSWIHVQDAVNLITFGLEHHTLKGPVNITAPTPKRNKDFMKKAAQVYKRPNWLHLPAVFFYLTLGEMAQLLVKGQYAYPEKALEHGFTYDFPSLDQALLDLKNN